MNTVPNVGALLELLRGATSASLETRRQYERLLQDHEGMPGFSSDLLHLAQLPEDVVGSNDRALAMICLKNTIHRNWNPRSNQGAIGAEEKKYIRENIWNSLLVEPMGIVAQQAQIVVAKMARFDWPSSWPSLFESLVLMVHMPTLPLTLKSLSPPDQEIVQNVQCWRAMGCLYAILKVLSSKRLPADRRRFRELSFELSQGLCMLWAELAERVFQRLNALSQGSQNGIMPEPNKVILATIESEVLLKCTKSLHLVIAYGDPKLLFDKPYIRQYLERGFEFLFNSHDTRMLHQVVQRSALDLQTNGPSSCIRNQYIDSVLRRPIYRSHEKTLATVMKTALVMQEHFSVDVIPYLDLFITQSLRVIAEASAGVDTSVYDGLGSPLSRNGYTEPVVVASLSLVSNIVKCREYRADPPASTSAEEQSRLAQARGLMDKHFGGSQVEHLCELAVGRFFILLPRDLEEWVADPEEYALAQEAVTKRDSLRPAAEDLLLSLAETFEDKVTAKLVAMLQEHEAAFSPGALLAVAPCARCGGGMGAGPGCPTCPGRGGPPPRLLLPHHVNLREALYLAVGLCAYNIYDKLDFPGLLVGSLMPLLQHSERTGSGFAHRTLHRRCMWLIGCWVANLTPELRPPLYAATVRLLGSESEDVLVRLTAVKTLQSYMVDWACDVPALAGLQAEAVEALYALLRAVEANELRQQVVGALTDLARRLEDQLAPCLQSYMAPVPWLWDSQADPAERSLLRASILRLLIHLVLHVDSSSRQGTTALLEGVVVPIVGYATDISEPEHLYLVDDALKLWVAVVQSETSYSSKLHQLFARFGPMARKGVMENLKEYMALIQAYSLLGGAAFMETYHADIRDCLVAVVGQVKPKAAAHLTVTVELILRQYPSEGPQVLHEVVAAMCQSCLDSASYKKTGSSSARFVDPDVVVAGYLAVAARLACSAPEWFHTFVSQLPSAPTLLDFVDMWLSLFDIAGSYCSSSGRGTVRQLLWLLAVCSVLARIANDIEGGALLQRLGQTATCCAQVLQALADEEGFMASFGGRAEEEEAYDSDSLLEQTDKPTTRSKQSRQTELFATDPLLQQSDLRQLALNLLQTAAQRVGGAEVGRVLSEQPQSTISGLGIKPEDLGCG